MVILSVNSETKICKLNFLKIRMDYGVFEWPEAPTTKFTYTGPNYIADRLSWVSYLLTLLHCR